MAADGRSPQSGGHATANLRAPVLDGDGDSGTSDLLVFNRPWDARTKTGTGDYHLDGPATKVAGGTWKGPWQQLGRDTKAGFAVELSAVVVSRSWAEYLTGAVTGPGGWYWTAKELPPHDAVATMVVTRDGTTKVEC